MKIKASTRLLKIILINLVVLVAFFAALELSCRHFDPAPFISRTYSGPKKIYSKAEAEALFGRDLFEVPKKYRLNFPEKTAKGSVQKNYEPHTMAMDYNNRSNKNKSYQVLAIQNNDPSDIVFQATYEFDSYGRRKVFNQDKKTKTTRFLLTLGDSLTFGEGLTSGFDYPSILASKLGSETRVYNFGWMGTSVNDFYLRGLHQENYAGITEPQGDLVYLLIPPHFSRYFRSTSLFRPGKEYLSFKNELKWEGSMLVDKGRFIDSQDFNYRFLELLANSRLLSAFNFEWPVEFSKEQLEEYVKTLMEIRKQVEQKAKVNRILIYARSTFREEKQLIEILKKYAIEYRNLDELDTNRYLRQPYIPVDKHPTAEFNWMFSEVIRKDLNQ